VLGAGNRQTQAFVRSTLMGRRAGGSKRLAAVMRDQQISGFEDPPCLRAAESNESTLAGGAGLPIAPGGNAIAGNPAHGGRSKAVAVGYDHPGGSGSRQPDPATAALGAPTAEIGRDRAHGVPGCEMIPGHQDGFAAQADTVAGRATSDIYAGKPERQRRLSGAAARGIRFVSSAAVQDHLPGLAPVDGACQGGRG